MKTKELTLQSERNRKRLIEIIYKAKAGHIGGDLSCLNVLTALYFDVMNVNADSPKDDLRDRFILSKGHCVEALYVTLESKGFITEGILDTLGQYGSILSGHPTIGVPGIEVNTGALGHGLSVGVGIAIAAKMDNRDYKTYVLMGDGEQGEGSIYEAAMAARQYRLDNLVAIIDRNHLQISGNTEDVMGIDDIHDRWTAFGWEVKEQYIDTFNILRIQEIHGGAYHTVNHIKWRSLLVNGSLTANLDIIATTGTTVGLSDIHTRYRTLQSVFQTDRASGCQLFRRNGTDRTG